MSDNASDPADRAEDTGSGKHGHARALADKAMRLEAEGDQDGADQLFDEAQRTDPDAVADALNEAAALRPTDVEPPGSDAEVERISRELEPHADAPNRAGITGSGSGADSE